MSATTFNVIISGTSVSGDLDTARSKLVIDLGNSDRIGKVEFALQNKDGTYKAQLVSGNATYQVDAIQGGLVVTSFRGTLERLDNEIDTGRATVAKLTGYDYGQELLGLISPDSRQQSVLNTDGTISLTSGEQGMGSKNGMDLVLYVSGVINSGANNAWPAFLGAPASKLSDFMSQYFGKSGDNTGSMSGTAFSFKPYLSGMAITGTNPAFRTYYNPDGASDTNANYWVPSDTLKVKHEYAWDVLRKLTRQGYVVDRSGFKTQFEVFIDSSGGINLLTSGTSNFISSGVLIYYQAGASGSANNNIVGMKVPFDTTALKNEIVGWFPVWSQYPFGDDYADFIAYSGGFWSGTSINGTVTLSGDLAPPNTPGFISIMATNANAVVGGNGGMELVFTLWSGLSLDIQRFNVSGGQGVTLNYLYQASFGGGGANTRRTARIFDTTGNYIIKSGGLSANIIDVQAVLKSGWMSISDTIFKLDGAFNSGDGRNGGWASTATFPDLTKVKQIGVGFGALTALTPPVSPFVLKVDSFNFGFSFNFNPVVAFSSGSISSYGRRYEVFEFPYQVTDSGAGAVVLGELQSKSLSRQLAEFIVKDNPNVFPAQFNITPGRIFIVDAPSLNTGSGQSFYYWRATEVKHEWSTNGFITHLRAYPWISGGSAQSGQNLISYSLPLPAPKPFWNQFVPITSPVAGV